MDNTLIIVISIIFSAFFSGMEIAYISSNKLKIELDKNKGLFSAKILARFIKKPSAIIGVLLIGNNIALVIYGIAIAARLEPLILGMLPDNLHSYYLILFIQTVVSTLLILFVAEFFPKVLFRINPNSVLDFFALPLSFFYWLLYPVVFLIIGLSEQILKGLFRLKFTNAEYTFSVIDLHEYVKELTPDRNDQLDMHQELQILQNAIDFRSVKLRECLIPRTEVVAVEVKDSIDDLMKLFIETKHSKILVYEDSIDHITGYIHSSDLFKNPSGLQAIIRPVPIVPETMLANNVLKKFIEEHKNIAVVVDEFGGTSGIVTMEDILEEIFGEIEDEYDDEDLMEKRISDTEYLFSARLEIDYLNEKYSLDLPESEDYETLGGLIINIHESIPARNDIITVEPFIFTITEAIENRIELVNLKISKDE